MNSELNLWVLSLRSLVFQKIIVLIEYVIFYNLHPQFDFDAKIAK